MAIRPIVEVPDPRLREISKPVAEVTYRPAKPGDPPLKEKFEIKERC